MKIWCIVLLLVLSAAAAVRAQTCEAGNTLVFPWGTKRIASVFEKGVVPPGTDTVRLANESFWMYFQNGQGEKEGLVFLDSLGKDTIQVGGSYTSNSAGIYRFQVFSMVPSYNQPVGIYKTADGWMNQDQNDYQFLSCYTFFEPRIRLFDGAGLEYTESHPLAGKVNDTLTVQLRLYNTDGIWKDHIMDTVKVYTNSSGETTGVDRVDRWYFDLAQLQSSGLKFLSATAQSDKDTVPNNRLQVANGVATFKILPTQAFSGDGFKLAGYPSTLKTAYRTDSSFAVSFVNPDVPSLTKAAIYDANGDGIGDSIAGWFSAGLDKVGHGDSLTYYSSWPNNGELAQLSGSVDTTKPSVLSIKGFPLPAQTLPNDTGDFAVGMIARANGKAYTTRTVLLDSIGPVIQKVTLLAGRDGASDTLVALFNKELDASSVKPGELLTVDGSPLPVLGGSAAGGRTWLFAVAPGSVQGGDKLAVKIDPAGLKTADGVSAGFNQPATVMEAGRIPAVASQGNGFYDRDADGRMDSVSVTFAEKISASQLASIGFHILWKDSSGATVDLQPKSSVLTVAADGKTVSWALDADSLGIMPYLTSIDSLSYGVTALVNTYEINGKVYGDTLMVAMGDSMPPVLVSAFLDPESSSKNKADKLNLVFSEAVNTTLLTSMDYLEFEVDGVKTQFQLGNARWAADGRSVELDLGKGTPLADRPNPADSLKLKMVGSGVQDMSGNASKANAQNVLLEGDPRVLVEVNDLVGLDRDDMGLDSTGKELPPVSEKFYPNATTMDDLGGSSLGILLDVGQATIPADSQGTLDLSKISYTWELKVYTSQGAYVAGSRAEVRCDDSRFDGDCFANRKKLYVRWNALSDEGRKAGVGVYVAKLRVKVKGQQDSRTIEEIYKWGVRAGASGRTVR